MVAVPPALATVNVDRRTGDQRLPVSRLESWRDLGFGMFVHFGMSTYDGAEFSPGDAPSTHYAPDRLDVDQWVAVAADAGMRYAVLTAKHVSGHCLWRSDLTDYHVGTSGNRTDVVEAFVEACARHGLAAGLYYCSWDNHHLFGSVTPRHVRLAEAFASPAYRDFQLGQVEELLTRYGPVAEVWIDIPDVLGAAGRRAQYDQIAALAPDAVVVMNAGFRGRQAVVDVDRVWPTDVLTVERDVPAAGSSPWHRLELGAGPGADYFIPTEVCDPIGAEWFHTDGDLPRSDAELLAVRLLCRERGAALLLDVPPDRTGRIPAMHAAALRRLARNLSTSP